MSTVTQVSSAKRRREMTPEQRQRDIERQRRYRRMHPDRCRAYRQRYILKAAQRLQAELNGALDGFNKGGETE